MNDCSFECIHCHVEEYNINCPYCKEINTIDDDELRGYGGDEEGKSIKCNNCNYIFHIWWEWKNVVTPYKLTDAFDQETIDEIIKEFNDDT